MAVLFLEHRNNEQALSGGPAPVSIAGQFLVSISPDFRIADRVAALLLQAAFEAHGPDHVGPTLVPFKQYLLKVGLLGSIWSLCLFAPAS